MTPRVASSLAVCHGKLGTMLDGPGGVSRAVEAEALFRRAIAPLPDLPDASLNLGTALVRLLEHRYEAAVPLLRTTALIRSPEAPGLRGYLAQALQGRAREQEAKGQSAQADALRVEAGAPDGASPTGPSTPP